MRTTLTLDDDVARLVQDEVRRSGESFEGTVNRLLRQGLTPRDEKPFVVKAFPLGVGEMLDRHDGCVADLLDDLEGPHDR